MKIAVITDTFTPQINGVVVSIKLFAEEMERRGFRVYIFAPDFAGRERSSANVIRIRSNGFPIPAMKDYQVSHGFWNVIQSLKDLKIDLIHSQVPGALGLKAVLFSRILKIPHIHTYHTHFPDYVHYAPLAGKYSDMAVEVAYSRYCNTCSATISPTQRIKDTLLSWGVTQPVEVIPTGLKLEEFEEVEDISLSHKYGVPEGCRVLCYVGRIAKEKDVNFLRLMFKQLLKKEKNIHFVFVGDGPDRENQQKLIHEEGYDKHFTFTGFVTPKEVREILKATDIFCFASKTDTQGLVVTEALASGTPAVVVDARGAGEIMSDGIGGFATADDPDIFAEELSHLLNQPERLERMKQEAVEKARSYSMSVSGERMENLYRRVIENWEPKPLIDISKIYSSQQ